MENNKMLESRFSELKDRQDSRNEKILKSLNQGNPDSDNLYFRKKVI